MEVGVVIGLEIGSAKDMLAGIRLYDAAGQTVFHEGNSDYFVLETIPSILPERRQKFDIAKGLSIDETRERLRQACAEFINNLGR